MLSGKPRLTTWNSSDQTMRLFELNSSGVFVQILSIGATSAITPVLFFHPIGDFAGIFRKTLAADTAGVIATYDYSGALINSIARPTAMQTATALWMILGAPARPFLVAQEVVASGLSTQANSDASFDASGNLTSLSGSAFSTGNIGRASPDGGYIFFTNTANTGAQCFKVLSYTSGNPNVQTPAKTIALGGRTIADARWTPDSRYLIIAYTNGDIEVNAINSDATVTLQTSINIGSAVPTSLDISPVGKFIVLGVNDSGTFKTHVLRLDGPIISDTGNVYTGPGQRIKFSADARYVVDAGQKKALHYLGAGVFEANDAMMANMPAGVTTFAISFDVDVPQPNGQVYNAALAAILAGSVDTSSLKIMLLDNEATFNATDTVTAIQTNEVTGGNWPTGGVELTDVTTINSGSIVTWAADATHYLVIGGNIQFYKVLIYDANNVTPLAFYDYGAIQTVDDSSYANFDLTTGFLKLVA